MSEKLKRMLYGGDYNPNQWGREVWKEDMQIFRNAHINSATINVFSWAKLQPSEEEYNFQELDEIVEMLSKEGYDIVLATSTAALPAWMVKKYPETIRTDYYGRHHKFGDRHNACPNSPVFQKYAAALVEREAERYGANPHVTVWHVSNEYCGECYCENCEKAFRVWLKKKYHTIDALNRAWNMEFWGHTVYEWDEIVLPNVLGDGTADGKKTNFAGISIDYRRFNSDGMLKNYNMERDIIRKYAPNAIITTNFMGTYKGLDYFKWAKEIDMISWDCYPGYDTPPGYISMCHDLMRGLKNAPFMLMEQTPSQQNWQAYNALKKPGQLRAQSYQTLAHGADTIQYFQLRKSIGGCEKFHGAVIDHSGTEKTRVFQEVKQIGAEVEKIGSQLLGSKNKADVGIIFDWDTYWALEYSCGPSVDLRYVDQIYKYYQFFYDRNIAVDMISVNSDFSKYRIIAAPVMYMVKEGMKEALETFVSNGGILILTYLSGIVNETDNVHLGGYPGPLRELAGIWVEETDALSPERKNRVKFADGTVFQCEIVCDLIHLEKAVSLAMYEEDFYAGMPAVTENSYNQGFVYYLGSSMDKEGIAAILQKVINKSELSAVLSEQTELEVTRRIAENDVYDFLINFKNKEILVPTSIVGKEDIITGKIVERGTIIPTYGVMIVRE